MHTREAGNPQRPELLQPFSMSRTAPWPPVRRDGGLPSSKPQLTTMVPTIAGWMVHRYGYVPAFVNFPCQTPTGSSDGSLSDGSLANVIVCITDPVVVHWIMSPTCAVCVAGSNVS